jgi:drug/metabolite transporter (DMT)-like permease
MWLTITISFYVILAAVYLVDKYLLSGSIGNPKIYTFYVGILGLGFLVLAPFVSFSLPPIGQLILALLAGAIFIFACFWFYKALREFETSRVVPAINGLVPLFTFLLVYIASSGKEAPSFYDILAFLLLVLGSFLITAQKENFINLKSLKFSLLCAFLMSLSFVITKYVYLAMPFWVGFIWIKIGGALIAFLFFIFFKEVRQEIFQKKIIQKQKAMGIFVLNQAAGGLANVLENWAISLAPLGYIALINALQGVQYVFLLVFAVILSIKLPQILKEEISQKIILQKIVAILVIGSGLAILTLK